MQTKKLEFLSCLKTPKINLCLEDCAWSILVNFPKTLIIKLLIVLGDEIKHTKSCLLAPFFYNIFRKIRNRGMPEPLFLLIKSLTRPEKTHLRKVAGLQKDGSTALYVQLFDAIDQQEQYDEEALLELLPQPKHFSATKSYLFQFLLEDLGATPRAAKRGGESGGGH